MASPITSSGTPFASCASGRVAADPSDSRATTRAGHDDFSVTPFLLAIRKIA